MICDSREGDYENYFYEAYDSVQSGRRKTVNSFIMLLTIVHYFAESLAFWTLCILSCSAMSLVSVTKHKTKGSQFMGVFA